jgi:hypothetical protein
MSFNKEAKVNSLGKYSLCNYGAGTSGHSQEKDEM